MKLKRLVLGISLLSIIFVGNIAMSIWTFKAIFLCPKRMRPLFLGQRYGGTTLHPSLEKESIMLYGYISMVMQEKSSLRADRGLPMNYVCCFLHSLL